MEKEEMNEKIKELMKRTSDMFTGFIVGILFSAGITSQIYTNIINSIETTIKIQQLIT